MFRIVVPLAFSLFLSACGADNNDSVKLEQYSEISIVEKTHPLFGAKISYNSSGFLAENKPSLKYFPDQGPILYDHIVLSPRVTLLPITDQIDKQSPARLTIPLILEKSAGIDPQNIYVLAWGDSGWKKFTPVSIDKKTATIEVTEILYDPFVVVADK